MRTRRPTGAEGQAGAVRFPRPQKVAHPHPVPRASPHLQGGPAPLFPELPAPPHLLTAPPSVLPTCRCPFPRPLPPPPSGPPPCPLTSGHHGRGLWAVDAPNRLWAPRSAATSSWAGGGASQLSPAGTGRDPVSRGPAHPPGPGLRGPPPPRGRPPPQPVQTLRGRGNGGSRRGAPPGEDRSLGGAHEPHHRQWREGGSAGDPAT